MTTEVVDAELVPHADQPPASTAVAVRERRREILRPFAAADLVDNFSAYQELCEKLLTPGDYQKFTQREQINGRWQTVEKQFKKKSAWRKLATAFDVDVTFVREDVERDAAGRILRATTIYRASAPSGRIMDGDGHCSIDESRFDKEKARERAENDVRATAATRAKNRAISDLLGTGEVSAEEISAGGDAHHEAPLPFGPDVKPMQSLRQAAWEACITLCHGDDERARELATRITRQLGGYFPSAAAHALVLAADAATPDIEGEQDEFNYDTLPPEEKAHVDRIAEEINQDDHH